MLFIQSESPVIDSGEWILDRNVSSQKCCQNIFKRQIRFDLYAADFSFPKCYHRSQQVFAFRYHLFKQIHLSNVVWDA